MNEPPTKLRPGTKRCSARTRAGERCAKAALPGLNVCRFHGGATKAAGVIADKARLQAKVRTELTRMERLTALIPEDDPEARGDVALVTEIRRTVNRVRILDEWINELGERALGWGITKRERDTKTMTGYPGEGRGDESYEQDVKTFEARMNVYYSIQLEERKHLANLAKIWISAGFKQRELDIQEQQVIAFNTALFQIAEAFGQDIQDPRVRAIVHQVMLGITPKAMEIIEA